MPNPTGRQPRDPNAPYVALTPHLRPISPPIAIDWYSRVADWGMMLNNKVGCCTVSADGHIVVQQSTYGGIPVLVTDDEIQFAYEESGYVPGDPSTDRGWTIHSALTYLHDVGIAGQRIKAFGEIDYTNRNAVKLAIFEFGALSVGVNLPVSAQHQFEAGEPWTVDVTSAIDGGHCICAVGYNDDYVFAVTWGKVVAISWMWWSVYVEEAWAVITEEWDSVTGLDLSDFGQEWADTFGVPNPFEGELPVSRPRIVRQETWVDRLFDWLRNHV